MKKSIIAISGIAALTIALVGCGGGSKDETTESTTAETTTVTKDSTTSTSATTESSESTTTAESTEKAETTEAKTAPSGEGGVEKATDASAFYDVYVNKLKDGFSESGTPLYYTSDASNYKYSVADNMTGHSVEATVESVAASLTDGDCGKTGEMLYATGKNATGSFYTAVYSMIGEGDSTSCYGVVEYLSDKEASPEDVAKLLSSEYVTFAKK